MRLLPGPAIPILRPRAAVRPRRATARRAVLAGVAFVALAQLGLNLALETVRPEWRDPEYGWRLKRLLALDRSRGGRPLLLVLGSSRTQMGIDPAALLPGGGPGSPVAFNLGQSGAGPLVELLSLRRALDAGVRPRAVLVEVMPPALVPDGPAERVLLPHVRKLGAADLRRVRDQCESPNDLLRPWLAGRVVPCSTFRFPLMSHALPGFLPWHNRVDFQWRMADDRGWSPYPFDPVPADEREKGTAAAKADHGPNLAAFHVSPAADRALRAVIEECRGNDIRVALYLPPEGVSFRALYRPGARDELRAYLAGLGVPVFDAAGWLPDAAFADGHHLTRSGATAFSDRLGRESVRQWLGR